MLDDRPTVEKGFVSPPAWVKLKANLVKNFSRLSVEEETDLIYRAGRGHGCRMARRSLSHRIAA